MCLRGAGFNGSVRLRLVFRHGDAHAQPIADDFDALFLGGVAVNFGVHLVEAPARRFERFAIERVLPKPAQRHAQLIALPGIAHVEIALE